LKIASVVINTSVKDLDKKFDYLISEDMEDIIKVGMRVIVPFGLGNKLIEGIVVDIKEYSEGENLKYIHDILDEDIMIDSSTLDLAKQISDIYLCSYYDAIKLFFPFSNLKRTVLIKRLNFDEAYTNKYDFLNYLKNDYIQLEKLEKLINKKIKKTQLIKLYKKGIIDIKEVLNRVVKPKKEIVIKVTDEFIVREFIEKNKQNKRLEKQISVLEILLKRQEFVLLKELVDTLNVSSSTLKALLNKGLILKEYVEVYRNPIKDNYVYEKVVLNQEQENAIDNILNAYRNGKRVTLLFGVTGSGKTEIYINLIEKFLLEGYGAIVLIPEISLTPQTVERFKGRFGDKIAVLHSKLSDGERYDEWRRIYKGQAQIVIGARSAVFSPVKNLKLIIIDEEHEHTYKSEITPKYDARDIAKLRLEGVDGLLILGSATPSIESYFKAKNGEYNLVEIHKRANKGVLPQVNIVDMRSELKKGNRSVFSQILLEEIALNLEQKNQIILFINRRGHSTFVSCRACGYVAKCLDCDITLTYHYYNNSLSCHYCGKNYIIPSKCPKCKSQYIKYFGAGTEKVETEIKKYFPKARVLRMDMDTTRYKGAHEDIYRAFKNGDADILIGTQMIAKGMDFKNVTLVGIITIDTILNLPDYKAAERAFQLISQVAGRAGRGEKLGKVIIQTYEPENPVIQFASFHDYKSFYEYEIKMRQLMNNPPFTDILYLLLTSQNEHELIKKSHELAQHFNNIKSKDIEFLGPSPCYISKIKNVFRWNFIIKGNVKEYYADIYQMVYNLLSSSNVSFTMDINPVSML